MTHGVGNGVDGQRGSRIHAGGGTRLCDAEEDGKGAGEVREARRTCLHRGGPMLEAAWDGDGACAPKHYYRPEAITDASRLRGPGKAFKKQRGDGKGDEGKTRMGMRQGEDQGAYRPQPKICTSCTSSRDRRAGCGARSRPKPSDGTPAWTNTGKETKTDSRDQRVGGARKEASATKLGTRQLLEATTRAEEGGQLGEEAVAKSYQRRAPKAVGRQQQTNASRRVGQIIRREWRKVDEYASTSYLDSELAITPSALLENLLRAPINFIWGQRAFDQLARELEWFWSSSHELEKLGNWVLWREASADVCRWRPNQTPFRLVPSSELVAKIHTSSPSELPVFNFSVYVSCLFASTSLCNLLVLGVQELSYPSFLQRFSEAQRLECGSTDKILDFSLSSFPQAKA
ncbi:hypothetical protein B0H13DRAFT_1882292 [Mycena leptocephala]|nr:hypothetical protein B0H13DRAFT_1882292 [Mycena leptocephala]